MLCDSYVLKLLRFVTSTLCAATFSNSYIKWLLRYVMLRFVAVPYEMAPPFHPPPFPSAWCLSFSVFLCVADRAYWSERGRGGGGGGRGAKSYDCEKVWSSKNHTILYCRTKLRFCPINFHRDFFFARIAEWRIKESWKKPGFFAEFCWFFAKAAIT